MVRYEGENLDVICQHCHIGKVIPMRIRVTEDGETHTYTIKEYKQITVDGAYTTPDGVYVCNGIIIFDCHIVVFGQMKTIRLYFNKNRVEWTIKA